MDGSTKVPNTVLILHPESVDRNAFSDKLAAGWKIDDYAKLSKGKPTPWMPPKATGDDFSYAYALTLHRRLHCTPDEIALGLMNYEYGNYARRNEQQYVTDIVREVCAPKGKEPDAPDLPNWQNLTREVGRTTDDDMHKVDPPCPHVAGPSRPMGQLTILAGPGGVGKSTEALNQGLCIAAGLKYREMDTIKGISLFVSCEDSRRIIKSRMQAWLGRIPEDICPQVKADIKENFFFFGNDEVGGMQVTIKEFTKCAPSREAIETLVKISEGAVSVLVETIAMLNGGDEMNSDLMQVALAFKEVAQRTGANVQGVHHVTKESVSKYPPTLQSLRGGGSLGDAARGVVIMVELPDNQYSKLHITKIHDAPVFAVWNVKASYMATHPPFYLRRLPGPVYELIEGASEVKGKEAAQGRLLQYMRKPENVEGLSLRQMQDGCMKMMIERRDIPNVLASLDGKGIKFVSSKTIGRFGPEHSIWVLDEKESRAQSKSELMA
ncbi:AAA family ATPase [Pseudomonas sp. LB3P14]